MSEENHYEILGVRPEAPFWEIELAYKGHLRTSLISSPMQLSNAVINDGPNPSVVHLRP